MYKASLAAVVWLCGCLLLGCAGRGDAPGGDELPDMNKRYLEAVRWKSYQVAARYWIPTRREAWLDANEAEEDIVNYQALVVRSVEPVPDTQQVEVRVRVELYRNDTLIVQKKNLTLIWEKIDGSWFVVKETWKDVGKPRPKVQNGTSDSSPPGPAPPLLGGGSS